MFSGMGNWGAEIIKWTGYTLLAFLFIAIIYTVYLFIQYKYKVQLRNLKGSVLAAPKWERARVIKDKGVTKWMLLLSRRKIKPVPYEYIYPKNRVYLARVSDDKFVPLREDIDFSSENAAIKIKPTDEDIEYWYKLQQKQIAQDYTSASDARKQTMIMIGGFVLIMIFAGFVVWLAFTKTDALVGALRQNAAASQNIIESLSQKIAPN